jgi:hypothetical protein
MRVSKIVWATVALSVALVTVWLLRPVTSKGTRIATVTRLRIAIAKYHQDHNRWPTQMGQMSLTDVERLDNLRIVFLGLDPEGRGRYELVGPRLSHKFMVTPDSSHSAKDMKSRIED